MPKLIERPQLIEIAQTAAGLLPVVTEGFRKGIDLISVKQVGDNTLRFIISNGSLDRDHDTIASDGWELANYRKNPVVLWAHSHSSPPIGKANAILIEDDALIAEAEFTGPDLNAFGDMIFKLYQGGFMRAVSVGFMPLEWVWVDEQGGFRFEKQELLEFSAVPVPANPEALLVARSSGIDTSAMKAWAEKLLDEWPDNDHLGLTNKDMKRLAKAADSKHKSYHNLNNQQQKDLRERNLEAIWTARLNEFDDDDQKWFKDWGPAPSEWDHAEIVAADARGLVIGNGSIPDDLMVEYSRRKLLDLNNGINITLVDPDPDVEKEVIDSIVEDMAKKLDEDIIGDILDTQELDLQVQIRMVADAADDLIAVLDAEKCAEAANLPDGWTSDDLIKVLAGPAPLMAVGEADQPNITVNVVGSIAEIVASGPEVELLAEFVVAEIDGLDWKIEDVKILVRDNEVELHADQEELITLRERLEHLGLSDIDTLDLEDVEVTAEERASIEDMADTIVTLTLQVSQWRKAAEDLIKTVDDLQTENDELTESVIESELSKEMETEKSAVVMVLQAVKAGVNRLTGRID